MAARKAAIFFAKEPDPVGKILAGLKQPEDFAKLMQADGEFAKRLFEYRDFTEAPFSSCHDGLSQSELEEFLVGLNVKKPVELKADTTVRSFEKTQAGMQDVIRVESSTWGYVRFEVYADGKFIVLPKAVFTEDFRF